MAKRCKYNDCENNSLGDFCFRHKPRKPMRKEAVKTKQKRLSVTADWFEKNPPDDNGRWSCYLQISDHCPKFVTIETINIEHAASKARSPKDKYNVDNLFAACNYCNELKGSKHPSEFGIDI